MTKYYTRGNGNLRPRDMEVGACLAAEAGADKVRCGFRGDLRCDGRGGRKRDEGGPGRGIDAEQSTIREQRQPVSAGAVGSGVRAAGTVCQSRAAQQVRNGRGNGRRDGGNGEVLMYREQPATPPRSSCVTSTLCLLSASSSLWRAGGGSLTRKGESPSVASWARFGILLASARCPRLAFSRCTPPCQSDEPVPREDE